MKVTVLQNTRLENIDTLEVESSDILNFFQGLCDAVNTPSDFNHFKASLDAALTSIESLSDVELCDLFVTNFDVQIPDSPLLHKRLNQTSTSFVKVNHGFWEMFSYILSPNPSVYRQRNINVLREQLEISGLLPYLIASVKNCIDSNDIVFMQSLTSGVGKSSDVIATCNAQGVDPIRRGVLTGNLLFAQAYKAQHIPFIDSFSLNYSYQQQELIHVLEAIPEGAAVLTIAPPHLEGLGIKQDVIDGKRLSQYYLAVSPSNAMQKWGVQLENMKTCLDYLYKKHDSITIFFQGVVLGPMLASLIEKEHSDHDIVFFDFGRLLDIEVDDHTLSHTGSPLPNKSIEPTGFFERYETQGFCFEALAAL